MERRLADKTAPPAVSARESVIYFSFVLLGHRYNGKFNLSAV